VNAAQKWGRIRHPSSSEPAPRPSPLKACGDRVQRSVFVATVGEDMLREARDRISQIINPQTDSVYIFRQCEACWEAVGIYGWPQ
jgi:CRISPR-associated endonuclease Cas2